VDVKKDKLARACLFAAVSEDVLQQIAKKKIFKEVWASLKIRFLGVDRVKKAHVQTLKSDFKDLRMKETESIDEFASKISSLANKLSDLGAAMVDGELVKKLLDSVRLRSFCRSSQRSSSSPTWTPCCSMRRLGASKRTRKGSASTTTSMKSSCFSPPTTQVVVAARRNLTKPRRCATGVKNWGTLRMSVRGRRRKRRRPCLPVRTPTTNLPCCEFGHAKIRRKMLDLILSVGLACLFYLHTCVTRNNAQW
jgi:hypothetical protein